MLCQPHWLAPAEVLGRSPLLFTGRAEPLHAIATHYHQENQLPLCYLFAQRAAALPYPVKAVLWVQADVYKWQAKRLLGLCGVAVSSTGIPCAFVFSCLGCARSLGRACFCAVDQVR